MHLPHARERKGVNSGRSEVFWGEDLKKSSPSLRTEGGFWVGVSNDTVAAVGQLGLNTLGIGLAVRAAHQGARPSLERERGLGNGARKRRGQRSAVVR